MNAAAGGAGTTRLRLTIVAVVAVCLFASLFARLWYLQVIDAPAAQVAAQGNGVRIVYTEAPRGRILERQGRVIVDNRISEVVTLSRDSADDTALLGRLAALLGVSVADLHRRIGDPRNSPYQSIPVAQDVDTAKIVYLREHQDIFPGVDVSAEAVRSYPYGTLAANLVGYTGQITDKQLAARKRLGYLPGDQIGQSGVEAAYEDVLRGQPGVTKLQVDSQGRVLGVLANQPPVQGHDLQLTIDIDVQKLAEESLAQGLTAARTNVDTFGDKLPFKAPAGAVTVLDPRDGSVLALATAPSFNPTDFVNGISSAKFAAYQANPDFPLEDRTIQGQYAPGSTFKLVTAIAGLQAGIITPAQTFDDKGFLQVGPTKFFNDNHQVYGYVNLSRAITVSSDAYFYNVGAQFWDDRARLGDDGLQAVARELGFGADTGIPLANEASGRVPDAASRKKLHDANPKAFPTSGWFTGDNVNTAIGQGDVAVTPLQLANAYAAFANGGTLWQPMIAARVLTQAGQVVDNLAPVAIRHIDLPAAERDPMLSGFEGVVADPAGTAHAAFVGFPLAQFPIAGKTGTAQVQGKQATSVFASFAPANNPQYVVDAFLEQSGYGAAAAAPVVRRIYDGLFGRPVQPITAVKSGVD